MFSSPSESFPYSAFKRASMFCISCGTLNIRYSPAGSGAVHIVCSTHGTDHSHMHAPRPSTKLAV